MESKKELDKIMGARVKKAREESSVTQEQLAEKIGVSPQFISDMERGKTGMAILTLKKISATLGVSSDTILFGEKAGTETTDRRIVNQLVHLSGEEIEKLAQIVQKILEFRQDVR